MKLSVQQLLKEFFQVINEALISLLVQKTSLICISDYLKKKRKWERIAGSSRSVGIWCEIRYRSQFEYTGYHLWLGVVIMMNSLLIFQWQSIGRDYCLRQVLLSNPRFEPMWIKFKIPMRLLIFRHIHFDVCSCRKNEYLL